MKKLLLTIFIVFVLIGNVSAAKSIYMYEHTIPTNVNASLVSGGTLTASTTYYYKVVATGPREQYYDRGNGQFYMSSPSLEVNATTNSTYKSIKICWDEPDPSYPTAYNTSVWHFYRTKISEDYDIYDGSWNAHLLNTVGSTARIEGLIRSQLTADGSRWCTTDTGLPLTYLPQFEDGIPLMEIEGGTSADPITPLDMYDWSVANGYGKFWQVFNYSKDIEIPISFDFRGSFSQPYPTSIDTYFEIPIGNYFKQTGGKMWLSKNGEFRMEKSMWHSIGLFGYYHGSHGNISIDKSFVTGSPNVDYPGGSYLQSGNQFHWSSDDNNIQTLKDSFFDGRGSGTMSGRVQSTGGTYEFINSIFENYILNFGAPASATIQKMSLLHTLTAHYSVFDAVMSNMVILEKDTYYDYTGLDYSATNETQVTRLIDTTYSDGKLPSVGQQIGQYPTRHAWQYMLDEKSVGITLFYENGSVVEGANITVRDASGYNPTWYNSGISISEDVNIGEYDVNVDDGTAFSIGEQIMVGYEVWNITNIAVNTLTVTKEFENAIEKPLNTGQDIYKRYDVMTTNSSGMIPTISYIARAYESKTTLLHFANGIYPYDVLYDNEPFTFNITLPNYQSISLILNLTDQCSTGCDLKLTEKGYPFLVPGGILIKNNYDFPLIVGCS